MKKINLNKLFQDNIVPIESSDNMLQDIGAKQRKDYFKKIDKKNKNGIERIQYELRNIQKYQKKTIELEKIDIDDPLYIYTLANEIGAGLVKEALIKHSEVAKQARKEWDITKQLNKNAAIVPNEKVSLYKEIIAKSEKKYLKKDGPWDKHVKDRIIL